MKVVFLVSLSALDYLKKKIHKILKENHLQKSQTAQKLHKTQKCYQKMFKREYFEVQGKIWK